MRPWPLFDLAASILFLSLAVLMTYILLMASQHGWGIVLRFNDFGEGLLEITLALASVGLALIAFVRALRQPPFDLGA